MRTNRGDRALTLTMFPSFCVANVGAESQNAGPFGGSAAINATQVAGQVGGGVGRASFAAN